MLHSLPRRFVPLYCKYANSSFWRNSSRSLPRNVKWVVALAIATCHGKWHKEAGGSISSDQECGYSNCCVPKALDLSLKHSLCKWDISVRQDLDYSSIRLSTYGRWWWGEISKQLRHVAVIPNFVIWWRKGSIQLPTPIRCGQWLVNKLPRPLHYKAKQISSHVCA